MNAASAPASVPVPGSHEAATSREAWGDALKGLLIVLVVLWHVIMKSHLQVDWHLGVPLPGAWGFAADLVWPFLLPLFMLVSGYFAAGALARPWSTVLHSRVIRFVWLYLLWSLVHSAAMWAFPDFPTFVPRTVGDLIEALTISPMNTWYVYALALYFTVAKILVRMPAWLVVGAAAALSVVVTAGLVEVVSNRGSLLYNATFFLLGVHLAPRIRGALYHVGKLTPVFAITVYTVLFGIVRLTGSEALPGVWPVLSLVGIVAGLAVAPSLPRIPLLGGVLVRLGQRSLPIYLMHMPLLAVGDYLLNGWLSNARVAVQLTAAVALPVALTALLVVVSLTLDKFTARDGLRWLWDLPSHALSRKRTPWRFATAVALLVLGCSAGTQATAIAGCRTGMPTQPAAEPGRVTVGAVGDVLIYDIGHDVPADGGEHHFDAVRPWFTQDLVTGNLEQVISGDTGFVKCKPGSDCLAFRSDPETAGYFAGFDLMNMANNHTGDFGATGYSQTRENLAANGIRAVGERDEIACGRIGDTSVAVVGFAPYGGTNRVTDLRHARKVIAAAAATADLVVVHAHMGAEGAAANVVEKGPEQMYGEDRGDVIAFSHAVVDAGADLVIGHGPHTLRGMELYRDRLIAYSLGNFGGGGVFGADQATRYGIYLDVRLQDDGSLVGARARSVTFDFDGGAPVPDPDQHAAALVNRFSHRDFPHSAPTLDPYGRLLPPPR